MNEIQTSANSGVVVVIDDDAAVRDALQFSLQIEGFAVRTYPGAWDLLIEGRMADCGCLVVDQHMAEMNGLELIERLRSHQVSAPAILITSHPNAMLRDRAAKAGVPIVEKPLLGSALVDHIRQSLDHCGPPVS
jgi:FixJ family two-component response regulator